MYFVSHILGKLIDIDIIQYNSTGVYINNLITTPTEWGFSLPIIYINLELMNLICGKG